MKNILIYNTPGGCFNDALSPGSKITENTEELFRAARRTLEFRIANGGGHTGWSCAWICHFRARLLDGDKSFEFFKQLLSRCTLENLFDNHPPFQIDGNFSDSRNAYAKP